MKYALYIKDPSSGTASGDEKYLSQINVDKQVSSDSDGDFDEDWALSDIKAYNAAIVTMNVKVHPENTVACKQCLYVSIVLILGL